MSAIRALSLIEQPANYNKYTCEYTHMRDLSTLVLASLVLVSSALAKSKPKNMSIWMMPVDSCNALFEVEQEPNPFLTNVIEFKEKGVVRFRRDKEMLENFPDDVTLIINYRKAEAGFYKTSVTTKAQKACEELDPSRVQFKVMWSNKLRTLNADGIVLQQQNRGPEAFCELKCADLWVYELRIESKNVPLTDNLVILIDSPEGRHLAKLAGGLGPLEHVVNPIDP